VHLGGGEHRQEQKNSPRGVESKGGDQPHNPVNMLKSGGNGDCDGEKNPFETTREISNVSRGKEGDEVLKSQKKSRGGKGERRVKNDPESVRGESRKEK